MTVTLWTKAGSYPAALPLEDVDATGRVWTDLANNPAGRAATGWTAAPKAPAFDPIDHVLAWTGSAWSLEAAPVIPPAPATPVRIGKYWLFERFTDAQERRFLTREAEARALTPAQIADPQFEGLYQLARFLKRLEALTIVELDAPATVQGFELLRLLGVFGNPADASSSAERDALLAPPTGRELVAA